MDCDIPIAIHIHGHEYIEVNTIDVMIADAVDKALSEYREKVMDAIEYRQ